MMRFAHVLIGILVVANAMASEPFVVFQGTSDSAPKQPQACISSDGVVHVTFGVGNQVYYCNLRGDTLSPPRVAFEIPNMSLGMRRGPRIASSGSRLVITAIGGPQGGGKDGDVLSYTSDDAGMSWSRSNRVNDIEGSAREGLHAMCASKDGTLYCVWLDLRDRGTKLFVSKSTDNGSTWSKNTLAYRSPGGSVCECCHPSILAIDKTVHILFRNSIKGDRDMYLVSSTDQGETFGQSTRLGQKNWALSACPMDGGMLAVDNQGRLSTVWRRSQSVLATDSNDAVETILGTGEQPWTAGFQSGFLTVWTSKRDGDLMLLRPGASSSEKLDSNCSFPIVVSDVDSSSDAFAFWEKRVSNSFMILGKRVRSEQP